MLTSLTQPVLQQSGQASGHGAQLWVGVGAASTVASWAFTHS
jgi:hypothetical protein